MFAIQGHEVGPLIYDSIVYGMQQVSTVAARLIMDEIKNLQIYDVPGEDVKVLTSILLENAGGWKVFTTCLLT